MAVFKDLALEEELSRLHDAYEAALIRNDIAALEASFWNSAEAVRYGISEQSYGYAAIAAYRQTSLPNFTDRRVVRRTIVLLGQDAASIMCEIHQKVGGEPKLIRQSQVWSRFPGLGWKIVAAHVSGAPLPRSISD
jgi:Protein of unknown function (DUF3225)